MGELGEAERRCYFMKPVDKNPEKLEWSLNLIYFGLSLLFLKPGEKKKKRQVHFFDKSLLIYLEARYCFPLDNGFEPFDCS